MPLIRRRLGFLAFLPFPPGFVLRRDLERMAVPVNCSKIRGTNPNDLIIVNHEVNENVGKRTSHARHCIIVSRSVFGSYDLPQRQNSPLKLWPYTLEVFSASNVL